MLNKTIAVSYDYAPVLNFIERAISNSKYEIMNSSRTINSITNSGRFNVTESAKNMVLHSEIIAYLSAVLSLIDLNSTPSDNMRQVRNALIIDTSGSAAAEIYQQSVIGILSDINEGIA